jgi:hypothetical protein
MRIIAGLKASDVVTHDLVGNIYFQYDVYLDGVKQERVIALDTEQGWLLKHKPIRCPNNLEVVYGTVQVLEKGTLPNGITDNISK